MAGDGIIDGSFTIKKGQGISQAIRDELGLTTEQNKKLGLSVWTEILNCVKAENDQRDGNNKIYTGGSDIKGDYRKNFKVNVNQVITLSKSTWDTIVSIVNNRLKTTIVSEAKEPPQKDINPPATDLNTPKNDTNPPVKDEKQPVKGDDLSDSDLPINQRNEKNKDKQVVQNDGRKIVYDENGYIIQEFNSAGKETRYILRKSDGSVYEYADYEYDANGNSTRDIARNSDGSVYRYYDKEYDANSNETRMIIRNSDGSVKDYTDYEYDANGNKTREIWRNSDGSVDFYFDYEYDANGNNTRTIRRNPDGSVQS